MPVFFYFHPIIFFNNFFFIQLKIVDTFKVFSLLNFEKLVNIDVSSIRIHLIKIHCSWKFHLYYLQNKGLIYPLYLGTN